MRGMAHLLAVQTHRPAHQWPMATFDSLEPVVPEILALLPDFRSLARACCTCRMLRSAGAEGWDHHFEMAYGRHSKTWGPALEPATSNRERSMLRVRAAQSRLQGRSHHRHLPFELGATPWLSPFYVSVVALDGPWLAVGEYRGVVSLWDLRRGRRLWQRSVVESDHEPFSEVADLHVDAVSGLLAVCVASPPRASVHRLRDGALLASVPHCEETMVFEGTGEAISIPANSLCRVHVYSSARLVVRPPGRLVRCSPPVLRQVEIWGDTGRYGEIWGDR